MVHGNRLIRGGNVGHFEGFNQTLTFDTATQLCCMMLFLCWCINMPSLIRVLWWRKYWLDKYLLGFKPSLLHLSLDLGDSNWNVSHNALVHNYFTTCSVWLQKVEQSLLFSFSFHVNISFKIVFEPSVWSWPWGSCSTNFLVTWCTTMPSLVVKLRWFVKYHPDKKVWQMGGQNSFHAVQPSTLLHFISSRKAML